MSLKQIDDLFRVDEVAVNVDNHGSALTELVADREQSSRFNDVRCRLLIYQLSMFGRMFLSNSCDLENLPLTWRCDRKDK